MELVGQGTSRGSVTVILFEVCEVLTNRLEVRGVRGRRVEL